MLHVPLNAAAWIYLWLCFISISFLSVFGDGFKCVWDGFKNNCSCSEPNQRSHCWALSYGTHVGSRFWSISFGVFPGFHRCFRSVLVCLVAQLWARFPLTLLLLNHLQWRPFLLHVLVHLIGEVFVTASASWLHHRRVYQYRLSCFSDTSRIPQLFMELSVVFSFFCLFS